jgi:hypothetical protein
MSIASRVTEIERICDESLSDMETVLNTFTIEENRRILRDHPERWSEQ